jgi:hypothetical protein
MVLTYGGVRWTPEEDDMPDMPRLKESLSSPAVEDLTAEEETAEILADPDAMAAIDEAPAEDHEPSDAELAGWRLRLNTGGEHNDTQ